MNDAPRSLTPRQRRQIRRATRRPEPEPSEVAGELNIVPLLDIVVNVMLFLLATTAATMAVAHADVELPQACSGSHCTDRPALDLSVTLTRAGAIVATSEGLLAADCASTQVGAVTVPSSGTAGAASSAGTGIDFDALAACLQTVHERHPEHRELTLSAEPQVPYEALIAAMDAAREGPNGPMFPRVRLSAGVR